MLHSMYDCESVIVYGKLLMMNELLQPNFS